MKEFILSIPNVRAAAEKQIAFYACELREKGMKWKRDCRRTGKIPIKSQTDRMPGYTGIPCKRRKTAEDCSSHWK